MRTRHAIRHSCGRRAHSPAGTPGHSEARPFRIGSPNWRRAVGWRRGRVEPEGRPTILFTAPSPGADAAALGEPSLAVCHLCSGTVRAPRFPTRTRRFAGIRVNFLAPDFWCRAIRTPACASTLCALAPSRKVVCCTGERRFAGMQPGGAGQKPAGQSSLRRDHGPLGDRRPAACSSESTGARGPLGSGRDSKLRPGGASLRNRPAAAAGRLRESALSRKRRRRAFGAAPPPMGAEADTSSHHD